MRIKKTSQTTTTQAQIVDGYSTSAIDGYSCNYVNGLNGKILWTNPSPTTAISSETQITLLSDDYDVLEIYYKLANNNERLGIQKTIKGYGIVLSETGPSGVCLRRFIDRVSDTSYTIKTYSGGSTPTSEQYLIPLYVIGYKTRLFD